MSASRSGARLTRSFFDSSRSGGSLLPTGYWPVRIRDRSCSATSSATRCFSTGLSIRLSREPSTLPAGATPCYLLNMLAPPRVVVIEGGQAHDVLEVIEHANNLIRARTSFLFEVGEELSVRIEVDGQVTVAVARVRGHVGDGDGHNTELELADVGEPRISQPAIPASGPASG